MASDTPTDAPRTGDLTAPPSEPPARNIGTNHRRKLQPHHRPTVTDLGVASGTVASLARAIAEFVRVEVDARVRATLAEIPALVELLSTAEAARYARVTPRSIRRWLDDGRLRARRAGRKLLISRADLDALLCDRERRDHALTPEQLAERDF